MLIFSNEDPYAVICASRSPNFLFDRMVTTRVARNDVVDFRRDRMLKLRSGDVIELPGLPEESDPFTGYIVRGSPRRGDTVLDAGAFCGECTIEFARLVGPEGHVHALEPDPVNREIMVRNLRRSQVNNVTVWPFAWWSSNAQLAFVATGGLGSALQEVEQPGHEAYPHLFVEGRTAAEIFGLMGTTPDFIKMDIEGAEIEAVEGMLSCLADRSKPCRLAIASYHVRDGRPTHDVISPALRAAGFEVETGYPAHLTTWAWRN